MIDYTYITEFQLDNPSQYTDWINNAVRESGYRLGNISFVFANDETVHELNTRFLNHDTLTDILTFDYTEGKVISGEIIISVDRIGENAVKYGEEFKNELLRVMSHGVLHLMGYQDEKEEEQLEMRELENKWINMFHVEH